MQRFSNRLLKLAKKGGFEKELIQFNRNINTHKYKIMLVSGAICFPLYKPFLTYQWSLVEEYFAGKTAEKLQKH
jgi:hypothetical protein